jgi:hypothetical protein
MSTQIPRADLVASAHDPNAFERLRYQEDQEHKSDPDRVPTVSEFEDHLSTYKSVLFWIKLFVAPVAVILAFLAFLLVR